MSKIELVTFDEVQTAAMTRALMAVAEEVANEPKTKKGPLLSGDVVDLLSDSDDNASDSECEILGTMWEQTDTPLKDIIGLRPFELKVEVKQEAAQAPPTTQPAVITPLSNLSEYHGKPGQTDNEILNESDMETTDTADETQIDEEADAPKSPETNVKPIITQVATVSSDSGISYLPLSDKEEATTSRVAAAVFQTDRLYDDLEDTTMDIIELAGGSDDDEMDPETEKKLIDLIESDNEEASTSASTPERTNVNTLDMLVHYICPQCGFSCGSYKKWKMHTDFEHNFRSIEQLNIRTIINREGELCYQCKDCLKKFAVKVGFALVLSHRINMHLPYPDYFKCRLCEKRYKTRHLLKAHLKREHSKICKHYLYQEPSVKAHVKYMCPICNASHDTRSGWNKHLEEKHEYSTLKLDEMTKVSDGVVECKKCSRRFCERYFKIHSLHHEKYNPFACKLCKDFSSSSIFTCTLHVKSEHLQQNVKRKFTCSYCDMQFDKQGDNLRHTQLKHNIDMVECGVCKKKFFNASRLLSHMKLFNHQTLKGE